MTFPVKWYSSDMEGAPLLSSGVAGSAHTTNPGSLIALLKAVLVTGFGIKSVSTLTYDSVAQTITAVVAAGHKYLVDQIVELSGANESGFNGEFRVASITSTTVVMGLDNGTPSAASATGTLSMKIPSLGWAVEFEDAGNYKVIFKRTDGTATPLRLYVDNSEWTNWNVNGGALAKVQVIGNPTDINTFTTVYEHRWPASHGYATPEWQLVGDSRLIYFLPKYSYAGRRSMYAFGDIISVRPGDNYNCIFTHFVELYVGATTGTYYWSNNSSYYSMYNNSVVFSDVTHKRIARSYHQLAGSVAVSWKAWPGSFGEGITFPNPADNGFYVCPDPVPVFDDLSMRGFLPGLVLPFASPVAYDVTNAKNLPNIPNKIIRFIGVCRNQTASIADPGFRLLGFDLTGPWR